MASFARLRLARKRVREYKYFKYQYSGEYNDTGRHLVYEAESHLLTASTMTPKILMIKTASTMTLGL